jgi:hypothetical protein
MLLSLLWLIYNWTFQHHAIRAQGTVIGNHHQRSTKRGGGYSMTSYVPTISFNTFQGRTVIFVAQNNPLGPPGWQIGKKVPVLYEALDPKNAKMGDFGNLWGVPLFTGVLGALVSIFDKWKKRAKAAKDEPAPPLRMN